MDAGQPRLDSSHYSLLIGKFDFDAPEVLLQACHKPGYRRSVAPHRALLHRRAQPRYLGKTRIDS